MQSMLYTVNTYNWLHMGKQWSFTLDMIVLVGTIQWTEESLQYSCNCYQWNECSFRDVSLPMGDKKKTMSQKHKTLKWSRIRFLFLENHEFYLNVDPIEKFEKMKLMIKIKK